MASAILDFIALNAGALTDVALVEYRRRFAEKGARGVVRILDAEIARRGITPTQADALVWLALGLTEAGAPRD